MARRFSFRAVGIEEAVLAALGGVGGLGWNGDARSDSGVPEEFSSTVCCRGTLEDDACALPDERSHIAMKANGGLKVEFSTFLYILM